jgi:hypothetical protein
LYPLQYQPSFWTSGLVFPDCVPPWSTINILKSFKIQLVIIEIFEIDGHFHSEPQQAFLFRTVAHSKDYTVNFAVGRIWFNTMGHSARSGSKVLIGHSSGPGTILWVTVQGLVQYYGSQCRTWYNAVGHCAGSC